MRHTNGILPIEIFTTVAVASEKHDATEHRLPALYDRIHLLYMVRRGMAKDVPNSKYSYKVQTKFRPATMPICFKRSGRLNNRCFPGTELTIHPGKDINVFPAAIEVRVSNGLYWGYI